MKKNLEILLVMTALFTCILMPSVIVSGAVNGVRLFLFTVIPTFFPFLFLSDYMANRGISEQLGKLLAPLFRRLFSCSSSGAYCIFMGFLCGYPMGAKTVKEAYMAGRMEREEACYLLSFCNNSSPVFLSGYVLTSCFPGHGLTFRETLLLFYLPPVFISFLYRLYLAIRYHKRKSSQQSVFITSISSPDSAANPPEHRSIDQIIIGSFYTLLKLGGYIILFSILAAFSQAVFQISPLLSTLLPGIFEITSGLSVLAASAIPLTLAMPAACAFTLFGGLSCLFQTASVLEGSSLPIRPYLTGKCIQSIVGFGLACLIFLK